MIAGVASALPGALGLAAVFAVTLWIVWLLFGEVWDD